MRLVYQKRNTLEIKLLYSKLINFYILYQLYIHLLRVVLFMYGKTTWMITNDTNLQYNEYKCVKIWICFYRFSAHGVHLCVCKRGLQPPPDCLPFVRNNNRYQTKQGWKFPSINLKCNFNKILYYLIQSIN